MDRLTALWGGEKLITEYSPEWCEIADEVRAATPPPQPVEMGPYRGTDRCPKCRTATGTTEYRRGAHAGCPIHGPRELGVGWGWWSAISAMSPAAKSADEWRNDPMLGAMALSAARAASVPEHFDRVCPNCKHSWVEGLPAPEGEP